MDHSWVTTTTRQTHRPPHPFPTRCPPHPRPRRSETTHGRQDHPRTQSSTDTSPGATQRTPSTSTPSPRSPASFGPNPIVIGSGRITGSGVSPPFAQRCRGDSSLLLLLPQPCLLRENRIQWIRLPRACLSSITSVVIFFFFPSFLLFFFARAYTHHPTTSNDHMSPLPTHTNPTSHALFVVSIGDSLHRCQAPPLLRSPHAHHFRPRPGFLFLPPLPLPLPSRTVPVPYSLAMYHKQTQPASSPTILYILNYKIENVMIVTSHLWNGSAVVFSHGRGLVPDATVKCTSRRTLCFSCFRRQLIE